VKKELNKMDETLKITSVLSDPTRYYIYQYILNKHNDVSVQEIADSFSIHPNVARLHLTKLEDVNMLVSETNKTGKGGRPSRIYKLSKEVVQLNFPFRDYLLLSKIAIETITDLGAPAIKLFYEKGIKFGRETIEKEIKKHNQTIDKMDVNLRISIIKDACVAAGFIPVFIYDEESSKVTVHVNNCPFKEVAVDLQNEICSMHVNFIIGMVELLFPNSKIKKTDSMFNSCSNSCKYEIIV
jgi:predicted ArsR family transcriptional regulator